MGSRCRLLVDLWKYTQVKLHGSYSAERVLEFAKYAQERNWVCAVGIMIATPIPCLVVTLLIDTMPLADPSEGVEANKLLFVREYYAFAVMTALALHQFRKGVPVLPYSTCKLVRDTLLVSAGSVGCVYGLILVVGFPLPFTNLIPMPVWGTLVFIAMATQWARKVRLVSGAVEMLIGTLKLWLCEFLLVFLYPPYFYVFTTISTLKAKMGFALLLPVLKLLMRNLFSRSVGHLGDETPGLVVFHADVFGSLFVAYCMQNSPLLWMTLAIMAVDILVMSMSLRDIEIARKELEILERRLHAWNNQQGNLTITHEGARKLTTLERASRILQQERGPEITHISPFYELSPGPPRHNMVRDGPYEVDLGRRKTPPSPFDLPQSRGQAKPLTGMGRVHPARKLGAVPSRLSCVSIQRSYTVKMRRLLYMAEFVLLLNYVEVVIPLVFSIYLVATYHLPNREYYVVFKSMDQEALLQTLNNVMLYCFLQLVSLLVLIVILKRMLGHSPIQQIAFVLEKQVDWVQMCLVFWLFYNVQGSLEHLGYDYSFRFTWLSDSAGSLTRGGNRN